MDRDAILEYMREISHDDEQTSGFILLSGERIPIRFGSHGAHVHVSYQMGGEASEWHSAKHQIEKFQNDFSAVYASPEPLSFSLPDADLTTQQLETMSMLMIKSGRDQIIMERRHGEIDARTIHRLEKMSGKPISAG